MNPRHTATLEPAPAPSRGGERAARVLVALAAAGLLAVALWPTLARRAAPPAPDPGWEQLAPPPEVRMPTWRWLVVSAVARDAHVRIGASHDDEARVELLPAWSLQRAVPGYPADAVVIRLGQGDPEALERRCAAVAAGLLRRIPTLSLARLGVDRHGIPPGLDQERLRFLVRERLGK
jgi:hypothetical protein